MLFAQKLGLQWGGNAWERRAHTFFMTSLNTASK